MGLITVGTENSDAIHLHYDDHGSRPARRADPRLPARRAVLGEAGARPSWTPASGSSPTTGAGSASRASRPPGTTTTRSPPTWTPLLDALDLTRRRPGRVLDGHRRGGAATSAHYGTARVAKAAFLGGFGRSCCRPTTTPTGVPQSVFDASRKASRPTATRSSPSSSTASTTSTRTAAAESARRRWPRTLRSRSPRLGVRRPSAAQPTWLTDFRGDLDADRRADAHPARHRRTGSCRSRPPPDRLAAALPAATYVEIEGAPHGMLWTHADEVNAALLDFLRS